MMKDFNKLLDATHITGVTLVGVLKNGYPLLEDY